MNASADVDPYNLRVTDSIPSTAPLASIDARELTVRFGSLTALDRVTIAAAPGTILGVIGPNGAGKSTLINCLTGLLEPTSGQVAVLGRSPAEDPGVKANIGIMPDGLELFNQLSAHEFLTFNGEMYGVPRAVAAQRAAELLTALDLGDFHHRLGEGSTGMLKKVAFAAALIHRPQVLFLDEPFESVDPGGVSTMKVWLRDLRAQGRTIWIASHALDTIERLCDRAALMKDGRLAWHGDVASSDTTEMIADGQRFSSLEALYFQLIGGRTDRPDWL